MIVITAHGKFYEMLYATKLENEYNCEVFGIQVYICVCVDTEKVKVF